MAELLTIDVDTTGDAPVVHLTGELDVGSAGALEEVLREADGEPLVVDLGRVTFIDSTGLRALIIAHQDRELVLRAPSPRVREFLHVAGMEQVLTIEG